ncbi:hypothetical protein [Roseimaritima ulvae]|uniref:Uncharacterized protein n=1 Tax=Roseimaritima ulvae TaxID=980254 RepID=A0A5B9R1X3_9BACT|nr:hypothetical protein [Roseimaritima ulvae]QEG43815.1 hypothetical protein UC8_58720 [Roseimaritima ulvae]
MKHSSDEFLNDERIAAAFDVDAVEPSPQHVEQLRRRLAGQINADSRPQHLDTPSGRRRLRFRLPLSLASIAAAALLVGLLLRPFSGAAEAGLQRSLMVTREAGWIHGLTTIEHQQQTTVAESWCSPAERIVAFRSPQMMHFVDYQQGQQFSYAAGPNKIFQWEADAGREGWGRQFVYALLHDQDQNQSLQSLFPGHDVSDVQTSRLDGERGGITQYSYRVRSRRTPDVGWTTTIQTADASGRILRWQDQHTSGMHVSVVFDYPDQGPGDIYQLGADRDAEIVRIATPANKLFGN